MIRRLLAHPKLDKKLPELSQASKALRQSRNHTARRCGRCGGGDRPALNAAKAKLMGMDPKRLVVIKDMLGIRGKVKLFVRRRGQVKPLVF